MPMLFPESRLDSSRWQRPQRDADLTNCNWTPLSSQESMSWVREMSSVDEPEEEERRDPKWRLRG